jgi:hypothetical protein
MKGRCNMEKKILLNIEASNEVIQYWRNQGYKVIFTFIGGAT